MRAWYREEELHLGPPKQQSVLALLSVQAGQPVPLHEIIDALWGDNPPDRAVNVVHRHVGALRRLLEPGLTQRSAAHVLVRAAGGYRLNVPEEALDLSQFRKLRDAGQGALHDKRPGKATDLLVKALSLWRGSTAAGLPHQLRSNSVFAGVDAEYFRAVQVAAAAALNARRTSAVLPLLRHAAHVDPLNETLQASLIRVLAAEGQTAQALEHYHSVRSQLMTELGVDAGPELRAAQTHVLLNTEAVAESTSVRATKIDPPAGKSFSSVRPAQLPASPHVLTGRRAEIEQLDALLLSSASTAPAISAIGGAPGVGKTAIALHWAHRNAHRFPDGQLYINLRGYDPAGEPLTPSMIICYFLESFGIPGERIPPSLDSQIALYRSLLAGRRCLIVLDNARNAEQVRPLLPGNPDCVTIITSREQMAGLVVSAGAHLLTVDLFTVAESLEFLSNKIGEARVTQDRNSALAIVRHCGRLPITLAIVCARAASRPIAPLADIAAELEESRDSLRAFTVDGESDPITDTRSVFSWSYHALTDQAAEVFRRLWMSPAHNVSLQTAVSLAGLPVRTMRQVMSELDRAHLWSEHKSGHYSTHDLLRVFSRELSRSNDSDQDLGQARQRLYDHYLHTAYNASSVINTHRDHPVVLPYVPGTQVIHFTDTEHAADWLHHEMPALQTIATSSESYDTRGQAWRMAAILELIFDRSGRRKEQIDIQSAALFAAQCIGDTRGQAHMHRSLGFALGRTNQNAQAENHLNKALAMFAETGDVLGEALTHRYMAFVTNAKGDHRTACSHYGKAASLYERINHMVGVASVVNEVGWTRILMQDFQGALEDCRRAIDIARKAGNRNVEAASWDSLGVAYHRLGKKPESLYSLHRALAIYRELADAYLIADTLVHIGDTHSSDSPGEARKAWTDAVDILDSLGHPEGDLIRQRLTDL
ncbi:AfsR/SARP family transcriptional regulator [Streptomyces fuscichromogenes]|uniref:AfsR/SARP family transcriptional regulator n=1 Tax=Streptomyces fuscichromogenes TaxID=1324013 RepID=UPI001670E37E|nr:BTAD domain-containing putative transcriptional regulator [Streptomyces fuscichromogenes]